MSEFINNILKERLKQINWKKCIPIFLGAFSLGFGGSIQDGKDFWTALGVGVSAGAYATYAFVLNPNKKPQEKP